MSDVLFLQMIQSLKALIENADAVYEKIVHCQKAGK
jgi:inactive phospholipase C-like protein 2